MPSAFMPDQTQHPARRLRRSPDVGACEFSRRQASAWRYSERTQQRMNIFFDVDETILGYDGSLRPLVKQVFQSLVEDGHRVFVWSGVRTGDMVRTEVVLRHGLDPYVTDCYHK